jgi:uncharacterized membrane protein
MAGRPKRLPFLRQEETGGKLRVTVRLQRAGWLRWLAGSGEVERTFALDALGREVYDTADGSRSVEAIVREFAARHKISVAEAESAVTAFLRTLMRKGLIAMLVEPE